MKRVASHRGFAAVLVAVALLGFTETRIPSPGSAAAAPRAEQPVALTDREMAAMSGGTRTFLCLMSATAYGADIGGVVGGVMDEIGCGGICGAAGTVGGAAYGFIRGMTKWC